ncbi:MAG: bacteriohemerythrin [Methylophilaceae bacterium]
MKQPLYIVWNQTQSIDIPILDEQHHAIVAAINSLYFFINQGWGLNALTPTLKIIKANIGFHLKTEEGVLEKLGADYKTMRMHEAIFNEFNLNANKAIQEALAEQEPMILLKYLRDWWLKHHSEHHAVCKKYLTVIEIKDDNY